MAERPLLVESMIGRNERVSTFRRGYESCPQMTNASTSNLHMMRSRHGEGLSFRATQVEFLRRTNAFAPLPDVVAVQGEAKQIGWNEP
jgi:hypothetical protein